MPAGLPADAAGPARGTLVGALEAAARLPDALCTALAESARDAFTHSVHVHALVLIPLLVALSLLTLTLHVRGWRSTSPTSPGRREMRHDPAIENALYRLVQEALTNVAEHAAARPVSVSLVEHDDEIELAIEDDGRGFDPRPGSSGFGLVGMRERTTLVGGSLVVASRPGSGTTVRVSLPATPPTETRSASAGRDAG